MDQTETTTSNGAFSTASHFDDSVGHRKQQRPPWSIRLIKIVFRVLGPVVPAPMSVLAYRIWFSTRRFTTPVRERHTLKVAQTHQFKVAGKKVFSWTRGEGPPVLFVHGWNGRSTQFLAFVEPLIERGYRVVGFDAPGHGKSDGNATNALEIIAAMQALQAEYGSFAAVVAHSFGVLCSARALVDDFEAACLVGIAAPANVEGLLEHFAAALDIPKSVSGKLRDRFERDFGEDIVQRLSTEENVKRLKIPGLIIHDENDSVIPWQKGQSIAEAYPGAHFMRPQGLGHNRVLRNMKIVDAVVNFIGQTTR